ncbi:hypothetical protein [Nocardia bovistercoris]|uniref:DUF4254 domain-containing protein n=1 Tax=Nocardia bovistercoris TaxID=2785916 RepID=A0A931IAG7_9NOCA|nr:hypothetical protein [Nocardia bovistercoris]MBH0776878.1 hypothetical protein [Nocardia bovistercoris]
MEQCVSHYPATRSGSLPDCYAVLAAFRADDSDRQVVHYVLRCARVLARLHRIRLVRAESDRVDERRTELVDAVDHWIRTHVPAPPRACAPDIRPGVAVDQLAAAYVHAESVLNAEHTRDELHHAWSRVGYLAAQWSDLVTAVVQGQPAPPRTV